MATRKIGPALAAGCPVILKPASETPLTALAIVAILAEAGVPDGVVNIVPSTRSNDLLAAARPPPGAQGVVHGVDRGRPRPAEHAARTVVSAAMELGGNAPFVVLADADLDAAVAGAMVAKLRNGGWPAPRPTGSSCTPSRRGRVHETGSPMRMAACRVGPGLDRGDQRSGRWSTPRPATRSPHWSPALDAGRPRSSWAARPRTASATTTPDGAGRRPPGRRDPGRRDLRPGRPGGHLRRPRRGRRAGQPHGVRPGRPTSAPATCAPALRVASASTAAWSASTAPVVSDPAAPFGGTKQSGPRPRGRPRGHARVHREQVRRRGLVTATLLSGRITWAYLLDEHLAAPERCRGAAAPRLLPGSPPP